MKLFLKCIMCMSVCVSKIWSTSSEADCFFYKSYLDAYAYATIALY